MRANGLPAAGRRLGFGMASRSTRTAKTTKSFAPTFKGWSPPARTPQADAVVPPFTGLKFKLSGKWPAVLSEKELAVGEKIFQTSQNPEYRAPASLPPPIQGEGPAAKVIQRQQTRAPGETDDYWRPSESENTSISAQTEYSHLKSRLEHWLERAPLSRPGYRKAWRRFADMQIAHGFTQFDIRGPVPFTVVSDLRNIIGGTLLFERIFNWAVLRSQQRATDLFRSAHQNPIKAMFEDVVAKTGLRPNTPENRMADPPTNPLMGTTRAHVATAYRAWLSMKNAEPPWLLLALFKKEGMNLSSERAAVGGSTVNANNASDARTIFRSVLFYGITGTDHFVDYQAVQGGDNIINSAADSARGHEAAFKRGIREMIRRGFLDRDVSLEMAATIQADSAGNGQFTVSLKDPQKFFLLTYHLANAFFQYNKAALAADSRFSGGVDPAFTYMRWNTGPLGAFLESAERHRHESQYRRPDGSAPSLGQWAFQSRVRYSEYGVPRSNAIVFKYFHDVFKLVYEGY